jgi:hypothetical protein
MEAAMQKLIVQLTFAVIFSTIFLCAINAAKADDMDDYIEAMKTSTTINADKYDANVNYQIDKCVDSIIDGCSL